MADAKSGGGSATGEVIFGFLSVLAGLTTLVFAGAAIRRWQTEPVLLAACVVPGLATVAFGSLCYLMRAERRGRETIAPCRALNPTEPRPWDMRKWQQGRIQASRAGTVAAVLIGVAAVFDVTVVGVAVVAHQRYDLLHTPPLALALLVSVLTGLGLTSLAVYQVVLARKYPPSVFEMSALPGVLGGRLTGTILLPPQVPDGTEVRLKLDCTRHSRSSSTSPGSSGRVIPTLLWRDTTQVRAAAGCLPVAFTIPFDLPPSDSVSPSDFSRVGWNLSATARFPGVDYLALFEVPVFATEASDRSICAGAVDAAVTTERPPDAKTTVVESDGRRTVFDLPKPKHLGCAVLGSLLLPMLSWPIGRYAGLGMESTVTLIRGVGLAGALFVVLLFAAALTTPTRIEVDRDAMRVPHGQWPLCWTRTIPIADITAIKYDFSGNPPIASIEAHTKNGKKYGIAALSGVEEAKWLTAEVTGAIARVRA